MGLIQKFFSQFATAPTVTPEQDTVTSAQSFSTPFFNIGKGNLAQPFVSNFYTNGEYVRFGTDNLYPQLLNQLYFQSPLHGAIIDFITNAAVGGGYSWAVEPKTGKDKVEIKTFERRNRLKNLIKAITRDLIIHARITVIMCRQKDGSFYMKRVDPSTIRNNPAVDKFAWSPDWSRQIDVRYFNPWYPTTSEYETLFVYQQDTPGQTIYPLPTYNSVLNWCQLDAETSFFHKNNLKNSVFPSIVIRRPKEFTSQDEIDNFREMLKMKSGAENAGSALVLTGNGFEQTPEVTFSTASDNDKLFLETAKEVRDNIAFAHKINPAILGIKPEGSSLGSKEEIEISYAIFEKNVILPLRAELEEVIGEMLDGSNIMNSVIFNNFQIVDKTIVQADSTTQTTI